MKPRPTIPQVRRFVALFANDGRRAVPMPQPFDVRVKR